MKKLLVFFILSYSSLLLSVEVSIIIPVYNEEKMIDRLISSLLLLKPSPELIFVDGGSKDATAAYIKGRGLHLIESPRRGRAVQLNLGVSAATGRKLLFMHADCFLSQEAYSAMIACLNRAEIVGGAFSYALDRSEEDFRERIIEKGVALRNILFTLPYGDQGYFIRRETLDEKVGYFKEMPLMEDVEWFERLKKKGPVV
ncbi:MAG: TIGR04283 family arsenosugar biosynthesis glycosyltransferase, partial [Anaerolineae bacterium]